MRRFVLGCLVVTTLVTSAPAVGGSPGNQRWAVCGQWRHVPVPDPSAIGELRDVAVVSSREAWAVGALGAEGIREPLVLHWTGLRWERVRFPTLHGDPSFAILNALAVVGPHEVWAVGAKGSEGRVTRPFAARWLGARWRIVPLGDPTLRGSLQGLAAIPGTDRLWAVGQTEQDALVMSWRGDRWRRYRLPHLSPGRTDVLSGVVAFANTTWAVGSSFRAGGASRVLAARWNGSGWRSIVGPVGSAGAVDGVRPKRLWAVGGRPADRPGYEHPAIFGWNGVSWRRVFVGTGIGRLRDVANPAPGVAWAVGDRGEGPFLMRLTAPGWTRTRSPDVPGWFDAIDGTPHNLWLTHAWLWQGGEPTLFDTYHRC